MFIHHKLLSCGLLIGLAVFEASPTAQATDNYILGRCSVSSPDSGMNVRPTVDGDSYLVYYHDGDPRYKGFTFNDDSTKVTLIKAPANGSVEHVNSRISRSHYHYIPNEGYLGQDNFVMQVVKNGVKVQIQYMIETVDWAPGSSLCDPGMWKISSITPAVANLIL